jgi:hypothetical protein
VRCVGCNDGLGSEQEGTGKEAFVDTAVGGLQNCFGQNTSGAHMH